MQVVQNRRGVCRGATPGRSIEAHGLKARVEVIFGVEVLAGFRFPEIVGLIRALRPVEFAFRKVRFAHDCEDFEGIFGEIPDARHRVLQQITKWDSQQGCAPPLAKRGGQDGEGPNGNRWEPGPTDCQGLCLANLRGF